VLVGIGIQVAAASWPVVAESLGNAAIPHELWGIVFGGALLSWVLAEAIARVVWRSPEATRTSELFSNPASTSSKAS
jgi:hypothetical protein